MRQRQIRRTNYNNRFNALSAVEVRTRHFIQLEWEHCADIEESFLKLQLAVVLMNGGDGNLADHLSTLRNWNLKSKSIQIIISARTSLRAGSTYGKNILNQY
jgi:hypothetical protein